MANISKGQAKHERFKEHAHVTVIFGRDFFFKQSCPEETTARAERGRVTNGILRCQATPAAGKNW